MKFSVENKTEFFFLSSLPYLNTTVSFAVEVFSLLKTHFNNFIYFHFVFIAIVLANILIPL